MSRGGVDVQAEIEPPGDMETMAGEGEIDDRQVLG